MKDGKKAICLQKTIVSLSVGLAVCFGGAHVSEAAPFAVEKTAQPSIVGASSSDKTFLAIKFEMPKPKAKPNINGRKRVEVPNDDEKQEMTKTKSTVEKKQKKSTSAKKDQSKKTKKSKKEKVSKKDKYERDAQATKNDINKRKASLDRSGISKQEQAENEIIMNYQMQKVAVELARRKLAIAQDASPSEVTRLKNQLAEEEAKLKPVRAKFDSLQLTLREDNVPAERRKIVKIAKSFVGTPYILGGVGGRLETDCGQFTKDVLAECGKTMRYRTADGQYLEYQKQKRIFTDKKSLKPGDLVFYHTTDAWPSSNDPAVVDGGTYAYKGVTHVGIYQGDGRVIHASTSRGRVIENATLDFAEIVGFGKSF